MDSLKKLIKKILKEQFEEMKPKIGDRLFCTKSVFNLETKEREFKKGKTYLIEKVTPTKLVLSNDNNKMRIFSLDPDSPTYYNSFFFLVHQEEVGF